MSDALDRLTVGHYMLRNWSLEEDVRHLEHLGFRSISLASTKLAAYGPARAVRLLRASGLRVAHLGSYGRFGTERRTIRRGLDEVRRALGWLHALGGDVLVVISGGRGGASWEQAARAYSDAYAELLPEATAAGVRLAIEVIHPLRQDLSFISTLDDAREIAVRAGRRGGVALAVAARRDAPGVEVAGARARAHHAVHDVTGGVDPGAHAPGVAAAGRPCRPQPGSVAALMHDRHGRGRAAGRQEQDAVAKFDEPQRDAGAAVDLESSESAGALEAGGEQRRQRRGDVERCQRAQDPCRPHPAASLGSAARIDSMGLTDQRGEKTVASIPRSARVRRMSPSSTCPRPRSP